MGRAGSCRRTSANLQGLLAGAGPLPPALITHAHGLLRATAWPRVGWPFSVKGNGSLSQPVGMALQTLTRLGLGSRAPTRWVMRVAVLVLLWPRAPLPWNFVTPSHGPLVPFPFPHQGPQVLSQNDRPRGGGLQGVGGSWEGGKGCGGCEQESGEARNSQRGE